MPATAFITADDVKAFSDPNSIPDADADSVITATILAVCEAVEQHLGRPVVARQMTKLFDGGVSRLRLPHVSPGVLTVSSVVEDGVSLAVGTEYMVYADQGAIVRLSDSKTAGTWTKGLQTVSVTFTAGVAADVATVPENLKLCAKIAVRFFSHMGWQDYGNRIEGGAWIRPDQFPRQCLWLMDPYRVVAVG